MPVHDAGKYRLITTNAIARWYIAGLERDGGQLDDPTIRDLLEFAEPSESVKTISRKATAVQVITQFGGAAHSEPPAAILFTEAGMPGQKPIGMCVRADVGLLYRALE
jgi:hypothetical protein